MTPRAANTLKRKEIVSRAAQMFDTNGYHTANVNSIAEAAGLKKPSLYHYFAGKDEILFSIHEEFINLLIDRFEGRAKSGLSPSDSLREVTIDVLSLMDTHRGHVRVFFEHHRELTPAQQSTIAEKRDRYAAMVEAEFARGVEVGEFRALDTRLTTLALFGMSNWSYQWYRAGGTRTSKEVAEYFWGLLFDGIASRPNEEQRNA